MAGWPDEMEGFEQYLLGVRGRAQNTALAYARDVQAFCAWCQAQGHTAIESLTPARCSIYLMSRLMPDSKEALHQIRFTKRSAARAISALQAWQRYLEFQGDLEPGTARRLQVPKYGRALPVYYKPEEMLMLVQAWDQDSTPQGLRNAAILRLLYSSALRVSECASARLGDLNTGVNLIRITGKGNKQRLAPFGDAADSAIQVYLSQSRPRLANAESNDWLWLSQRGRKLGVRAIQTIVSNSALRAGLERRVTPHKLRHACATHMLEGGADVRLLQEMLGHSSLQTTQVYTQVSRQHLLDAYENTHPRA